MLVYFQHFETRLLSLFLSTWIHVRALLWPNQIRSEYFTVAHLNVDEFVVNRRMSSTNVFPSVSLENIESNWSISSFIFCANCLGLVCPQIAIALSGQSTLPHTSTMYYTPSQTETRANSNLIGNVIPLTHVSVCVCHVKMVISKNDRPADKNTFELIYAHPTSTSSPTIFCIWYIYR